MNSPQLASKIGRLGQRWIGKGGLSPHTPPLQSPHTPSFLSLYTPDFLTPTERKSGKYLHDECSFVSLRDVHRLLDVASWFYSKRTDFFPAMDKLLETDPFLTLKKEMKEEDLYNKLSDSVKSIPLYFQSGDSLRSVPLYFQLSDSVRNILLYFQPSDSSSDSVRSILLYFQSSDSVRSILLYFQSSDSVRSILLYFQSSDSPSDSLRSILLYFQPIDSARTFLLYFQPSDSVRSIILYFQSSDSPSDSVRSILLAIGVCYLARLESATRKSYAKAISASICQLMGGKSVTEGVEYLFQQVNMCQDLFTNKVVDPEQHKNIAKNKALKENVFMMIVCIETRIPLFVIGKPGSSKSLSKSMVVDAMKGDASRRKFFKTLKNTYVVSFQCSRYATTSGIVNVFKECASFQDDQDLDKFVSVVVLDEVGLAEDSENMPLKALHPLLENGCVGNEEPAAYKKCAFIGISNWALDPAKMNRGIFIQIGSPNDNELQIIAREICRSSTAVCGHAEQFIGNLAKSYQEICKAKKPEGRDMTEFFGLRDFYSLMKMVVGFARQTGKLNKNQLKHSVKRNFGGFDPDDRKFQPMEIFMRHCPTFEELDNSDDDMPTTDSIGLVQAGLFGTGGTADSRYLLILTENLSVLNVILDEFSAQNLEPEVVFGSRFSDDVSYTQVCHNVYRIKMCMDIGRPVILLNLDDLYESLYDTLNQYFSMWGNKKFVDLGLGTHRVKAFVHDSFRLVLIAEKSKVHSKFPIPLINRLEKHYMSATSLLDEGQKGVRDRLEKWMQKFFNMFPVYMNSQACPMTCESCDTHLSSPYHLVPCHHYIGKCCRDRMTLQQSKTCPKKDCGKALDEDFQWQIDERALKNRQYFEKSNVTSSFIGYSSEMVSLIVKQTSEEVPPLGLSYDKILEEVKA
ncbi:E3 ubiquitin-protein ligase RNF213-like [Watersipora subatra]|uniref:E3 ubiquitin-protein ligase RNF213-like n=1 Tax=Watersipora subatra TaxID=2589382 RepID=UPI00355B7C04